LQGERKNNRRDCRKDKPLDNNLMLIVALIFCPYRISFFFFQMSFKYPLILDGGFASELERGFGVDLSGKKMPFFFPSFVFI
jgi:hypothetical protein